MKQSYRLAVTGGAVIALVALMMVCSGCPKAPPATGPGPGEVHPTLSGELKGLIPCGMIIPLKAAFNAYEDANPGVQIIGVFDNAGVLVDKLRDGMTSGDFIVTPGSTEMNRVAEKGLIDEATRRAVGTFELVVVVPKDSVLTINSPADLRQCETITMPEPSLNSVGTSGKEALQNLGLWDELKPKLVLTKHAIQSFTMVAAGKADAALVYRNCPLETNPEKLSKSKVQVACEFPADSYTPQECLLAVLKDTPNRETALHFVEYLSSAEGLKVLSENGMTGCLDLSSCPVP
jgi:molybdate transport system substrate-binding protein